MCYGEKEEAFSGTTIKDTWTKPRGLGSGEGYADGWGGAEWWGEIGDSCLEQQ